MQDARFHIALPVKDLAAAQAFYARLFHSPPTKVREGYARFEPASPRVVLTLNQSATARPLANTHMGIRHDTADAMQREAKRLDDAGFAVEREEQIGCCYAVQDKAWVKDPDGNSWEIYVVTDDDSPTYAPDREGGCCPDGQCGA